jgi:hypothetical protein
MLLVVVARAAPDSPPSVLTLAPDSDRCAGHSRDGPLANAAAATTVARRRGAFVRSPAVLAFVTGHISQPVCLGRRLQSVPEDCIGDLIEHRLLPRSPLIQSADAKVLVGF